MECMMQYLQNKSYSQHGLIVKETFQAQAKCLSSPDIIENDLQDRGMLILTAKRLSCVTTFLQHTFHKPV